jgi:hypothetical protein
VISSKGGGSERPASRGVLAEVGAEMTRTFTTATDDSLIHLIQSARTRLALIAPALYVVFAIGCRALQFSTWHMIGT